MQPEYAPGELIRRWDKFAKFAGDSPLGRRLLHKVLQSFNHDSSTAS